MEVTAAGNGTTELPANRGLISDETSSEVFLQLLVAQMRAQDPLEPQDPTQFITQLANFSSLEQQLAMKQSLEAIEQVLAPIADPVEDGETSQ